MMSTTIEEALDIMRELSEGLDSIPDLIDAVNDHTAAVRAQTDTFRELLDKADYEVEHGIPLKETPKPPLGVGDPPPDADKGEWNRAAIQHAIQTNQVITFNYRKVDSRWWLDEPVYDTYGSPNPRQRLVRPYRYEATGSADNTAVVRAYDLDDNEMSKTFRLDRIDGYVLVLVKS